MALNLIGVKDLPPSGRQLGNILDVTTVAGKNEDGMDFKDLVLRAELDATDKAGKKYQLEKRYNVLGLGLSKFRRDFKDWSGRKLKDQDLVAFDADTLMKGQRATFEIKPRKEGKQMVAVINRLLPVAAAAQASG
jgi:hypothetical protein